MLSHGALLRKNFFNVDQMLALIKDFHQANLAPDEVALMNFAQLVIKQPYRISNNDIEELRMYGFSDDEILDIVLVASARSLFSKTLDALGVEPDAAYLDLEPELINALAIGRPFPVEEITKVKR